MSETASILACQVCNRVISSSTSAAMAKEDECLEKHKMKEEKDDSDTSLCTSSAACSTSPVNPRLPVMCGACKKFYLRCKSKAPDLNSSRCSCSSPTPGSSQANSNKATSLCWHCRYEKCLSVVAERQTAGLSINSTGNKWANKTTDGASSEEPIRKMTESPSEGGARGFDVRLIPCQVCGASSSGYHFGVMSCEGCKGFFRRSLPKHKLYRCKHEEDASSDPKNQRAKSPKRKDGNHNSHCKRCRFDACVAAGMSLNAVRTGRHSIQRKLETCARVQQLVTEKRLLPNLVYRREQRCGWTKNSKRKSASGSVKLEPADMTAEMLDTDDSDDVEVGGSYQSPSVSPTRITLSSQSTSPSKSSTSDTPNTSVSPASSQVSGNVGKEMSVSPLKTSPISNSRATTDTEKSKSLLPVAAKKHELMAKVHFPPEAASCSNSSNASANSASLSELPQFIVASSTVHSNVSSHSVAVAQTSFQASPQMITTALEGAASAAGNNISYFASKEAASSLTVQIPTSMNDISSEVPSFLGTTNEATSFIRQMARPSPEIPFTIDNGFPLHGQTFQIDDVLRRSIDASASLSAISSIPSDRLTFEMSLTEAWQRLMSSNFEPGLVAVTRFIRHIPGFEQLSMPDRLNLFGNAFCPILLAQLSLDYNPYSGFVNYFNLHDEASRQVLRYLFNDPANLCEKHLRDAGNGVSSWQPSAAEFAILCGLLFFDPSVSGLTEPDMVRDLHGLYKAADEAYNTRNFPGSSKQRGVKFSSLAGYFKTLMSYFNWGMMNVQLQYPHLVQSHSLFSDLSHRLTSIQQPRHQPQQP